MYKYYVNKQLILNFRITALFYINVFTVRNRRSLILRQPFLVWICRLPDGGRTIWPKHEEMYSYNKSQQDALFLNVILVKNSTCFGQT
jgi:hypothetical protein